MQKELVELDDRERKFIEILLENGGKLQKAAEEAGFHPGYAYKLRDRLSKAIIQAAQEHLALNSVKAAQKVIDSIDAEMPNPIHLQAATALLDRVGIIKKDPNAEQGTTIKSNIFILPEKHEIPAIEVV